MKIFYKKDSVDCMAAVYLIKKHLNLNEHIFSDSLHDISELKDTNTIANINATEIVFIIGWHGLNYNEFMTLTNMSNKIYWYSSEDESIKFVEQYPDCKPNILSGLIEKDKNTKTSMLIYLALFTDYIKPNTTNIHRYLRKTYDLAPPWLQYINMTCASERSERLCYAISKEMSGPDDKKWESLDKTGLSAMAELIKWLDRGFSLMKEDAKAELQESLLAKQGAKQTYIAPDNWN